MPALVLSYASRAQLEKRFSQDNVPEAVEFFILPMCLLFFFPIFFSLLDCSSRGFASLSVLFSLSV